MRSLLKAVLVLLVLSAVPLEAEGPRLLASAASDLVSAGSASETTLPLFAMPPASLSSAVMARPQLSPELALEVYQKRSSEQALELASYSATSVIRAELPDSDQRGELEVQRHYANPRSLEFKAVRFTGDGFVKSNVITRMLQAEVDHVRKDDVSQTALNSVNYKFSYKGQSQLDGRTVHVFQVKPYKKRVGLLKGRVYLDALSGSLVRLEGTTVKSPSFFVKKIDFTQDYADFGVFTFPVRMHSDARARIIGRAVVDINYRDYQPIAATATTETSQTVPSL
jgi:hypothetical protein